MDWVLLLGSVAGVLALAIIAWLLGLGGAAIADQAQARRAAEEAQIGFRAEEAFVSTDSKAALVRGRDGDWMLLKVHGAGLAARHLPSPLAARRSEDGVTVATGERMYGDVRLKLAPETRDKLLTLV